MAMPRKEITEKRNDKELSHLMAKPFSEKEKETVKSARKKAGIDRPVFYHDAIVEYANRINEERPNA